MGVIVVVQFIVWFVIDGVVFIVEVVLSIMSVIILIEVGIKVDKVCL